MPKKEKTPMLPSEFRALLKKGKAAQAEVLKNQKLDAVPFIFLDNSGKLQTHMIDVYIKAQSAHDVGEMWMLTGLEREKCSSYTAQVITGAVDEDGVRIFSKDDIDVLESPRNSDSVLIIAMRVQGALGISEGDAAVEKPS